MSNDIWSVAEIENGKLKNISLQLASKAAELATALGGKSVTVALGQNTSAATAELGSCGIQTVLASESDVYDQFLIQPAAEVLASLIQEHQPAAVLYGCTQFGRDLASRVAARLGLGIEYNVSELHAEGGQFIMDVPAFGGQVQVKMGFVGEGTKLIGARQNAFPTVKSGGSATVQQIPAPAGGGNYAQVVGLIGTAAGDVEGHLATLENGQQQWQPSPSRSKLEEAQFIVSGGRGLGGPEGFAQIEELAKVLEGSVGASRAAVDAGWIPYGHQVGQTGKTVKPSVYIACGISGAVQHKAGMGTSNIIIAINKDKDAPIFSFCDLGIVGDLNAVVPQLTEEVKKRKA